MSYLDNVNEILEKINERIREDDITGTLKMLHIYSPLLRKIGGDFDETEKLATKLAHENEYLREQIKVLKKTIHILSGGQTI